MILTGQDHFALILICHYILFHRNSPPKMFLEISPGLVCSPFPQIIYFSSQQLLSPSPHSQNYVCHQCFFKILQLDAMFRSMSIQMQKLNGKLLWFCPANKIYEELKRKHKCYNKLYFFVKQIIQMTEKKKKGTQKKQ